MQSTVVMHTAPERAELRYLDVADPAPGQVLVKTRYSAVSPGTEALIFQGRIPPGLPLDETLASLSGRFAYPFAYGYACVGEVVAAGSGVDPEWLGRRVFAFHPHQGYFCVPVDQCLPLSADISAEAALFLPNMETAVNFALDAGPLIGERFLVLGQGVVGLLTTALLSAFPLSDLVAVDPVPGRREWARALGASSVIGPQELATEGPESSGDVPGFDAVIELSGSLAALNQAIAVAGFAGRILIGSWYGKDQAALNLGGAFHRRRLRLVSSQVSSVAPELSGRWNQTRRLALAWQWVKRLDPARLITHMLPPERCQEAFELAAAPAGGALQIVFRYP